MSEEQLAEMVSYNIKTEKFINYIMRELFLQNIEHKDAEIILVMLYEYINEFYGPKEG